MTLLALYIISFFGVAIHHSYIWIAGTGFERSGFGLECDFIFQSSQRSCSKIGNVSFPTSYMRVLDCNQQSFGGRECLSADSNVWCSRTNILRLYECRNELVFQRFGFPRPSQPFHFYKPRWIAVSKYIKISFSALINL